MPQTTEVNPTPALLRVEITLDQPAPASLTLRDLTGRRMGSQFWPQPAAYHAVEWDLGSLPEGFYLLETEAGRHRHVQKIVRTR